MTNPAFLDRMSAPIQCPLKKSVIAFARCAEYREQYNCLCKEARERLRITGQGKDAFEQKLREIKQPIPDTPTGWKVEKLTRFYMIYDETGELMHRATNREECDNYLQLVARSHALAAENHKLWKLLEEELIDTEDPWQQLNQKLAAIPDNEPESGDH